MALAARTIAHAGGNCTFEIPPPPSQWLTAGNISVHIGDIPVFQDANNGWTYNDATMTTLRFHGSACERASGDPAPPTFVTFNCLAV
jgi:hypothetical protein